MEAFWGTIKDIKDNTDRIDSQTQALSQLHAQTLECIDPMERAALAKQAEALADDITDLGTTNRLLIKNLTTENRNIAAEVGPSEPSMRIRTNQVPPARPLNIEMSLHCICVCVFVVRACFCVFYQCIEHVAGGTKCLQGKGTRAPSTRLQAGQP